MNILKFVGPALRFLNNGIGKLANKSDDNPKTSSFVTVAAVVSGWLGLDMTRLLPVADFLQMAASALRNVAGG